MNPPVNFVSEDRRSTLKPTNVLV